MENKKIATKAFLITRTAIFMSLLIILQITTSISGNVLITGSVVNFMLIISIMTCGLASGLTIAVISPFLAKLLGIGPLWTLIPFIALGNIVLVLLWHFIGKRTIWKNIISYVLAIVISSIAKFLVLYLGIVKMAIPLFLNLPAPQANIISNMFSVTQLITAIIGGVLAMIILPTLKKAIKM